MLNVFYSKVSAVAIRFSKRPQKILEKIPLKFKIKKYISLREYIAGRQLCSPQMPLLINKVIITLHKTYIFLAYTVFFMI